MPELPEVETVRRALEPDISGKTVRHIALHRRDLRIPIPPGLTEESEGRRITALRRRSKYLLFHLENRNVLISHLGMSGTWLYHPKPPEERRKHDHIALTLGDGSALIYNDPRRFGLFTAAREQDVATHPLFAGLGPEPLEPGFDGGYLHGALKKRTLAIKQAIMTASVVVGVGNIYASESLFRAGIRPDTPCHALSEKRLDALASGIKDVLSEAIASGGSTLRDYVRSSGDPGYFQHNFRVYGRAQEPCLACETPIERMVQQNRSTYYCPTCQRG